MLYTLKLNTIENKKFQIIWLHGWGVSHQVMLNLASCFVNQCENYLVDLPGFGKSDKPNFPYSSENYADDIADFIKTLPQNKKTIVVGHSHGGRIGIILAKKYSEIINGLVLIAGAGIPPKHSPFFKIYSNFIKIFSPIVKKVFPFLKNLSISSQDYKNCEGIMRETFLKLIKENLKSNAEKIKIPTLLIYGDKDTATPVYMGKAYNSIIANSNLKIIKNANHSSLLFNFSTLIHHYITTFIREKIC